MELLNRRLTGRHFHKYIKPERDIDVGALAVHGITSEFLADKPTFDRVAEEFLAFIDGAELIIHNAPFDVGFIDAELQRLDPQPPLTATLCSITDSLVLARSRHPASATAWTPCASATVSTTRPGPCTVRCWTRRSWPMASSP